MNSKLFSLFRVYRNITTNTYPNLHNYVNSKLVSYQIIYSNVRFSTGTQEHNVVTYDEVKKVCEGKCVKTMLIDVREPEELSETGVLPSSINIPLGTLENTLRNMPNAEFLCSFGREKPNEDVNLIFVCRIGRRSSNACDIAKSLGFKNVKNYAGGWIDWEEKNKSELK